MPSLRHVTLTAVLTLLVLVSSAGLAPGTGATSVDGRTVSVQADAIDTTSSADSYRSVTNMDVSIGADRTFTNETTLVNRSMGVTSVYSTDSNHTTHVVGDRVYRNVSDGWQVEPIGGEIVPRPARDQLELLNSSRVIDVQRTRTDGRRTYQFELAPENSTLAATVAAQSGNGVARAASVTVLDHSYEIVVNRTTHRVQRAEMTLEFRHEGEIGRATMVTWFAGYNETVPSVPERASSES
jgi:hypothetical protein